MKQQTWADQPVHSPSFVKIKIFNFSFFVKWFNSVDLKKAKEPLILPARLCQPLWPIIKVPGHSKLDSLEVEGNHLTDISEKNAAIKGTNN